MAGSYTDVPDQRIAYDRDGSFGVRIDSGVISIIEPVELAALNDESGDSFIGDDTVRQYVILFPEPRDVIGVYWASGASGSGDSPVHAVQTSTDTTSGLDGIWTTRISGVPGQTYGTTVAPDYRTMIQGVSWPGIAAIRWTAGHEQYAFHAYGRPSVTSALHDRLMAWDPFGEMPLSGAALDFGNAPQESSSDRRFRIKNVSPTKTANGITVLCEALTDTDPSLTDQILLSADGTLYTSMLALGSILPNGTSNMIYIRRVTPSDAQLGPAAFRLVAHAASFA